MLHPPPTPCALRPVSGLASTAAVKRIIGSACFYADEDYRFYLDHLTEQAVKHGCILHAYCLMTNHVHLLLTPQRENSLGGMMKTLGQRYVASRGDHASLSRQ
jgi:REP element-mobilizing transposase RayT